MRKFNRDSAFSIAVKDPDNLDKQEAILESLVIGDSLYLIKANSIYRMLTADSIDPERTELGTKHSYEKVADFGCSSEYVARVLMQAVKLVPFINSSDAEKDEILSHIWGLNSQLLNCRNVVSELEHLYQELIPKCNQIISGNQNNDFLPALPKVPELDSKVRVYLTNAKLVLIDTFKFLSLFYAIPINDRNESHFNKHVEFLNESLGADNEIVKLLAQDFDWIRLLSECRNAIEHSGEGQRIEVENFSIKPGNRFSLPVWTYDLTKKLKVKKGPHDLLNDLDVLCSNMMHLIEDLIVLVVMDKLKSHPILALYKIDEQALKSECPVRYDVTLKNNMVS
ncbi:hypothetical protein C9I94_24375 [Photobacterium swingsii]|uniref:Uncharacterized protein n=1 Tax=Photobacterium swingsii TaxID=680026 RepID=A0A2T3NQW0_9GAMM|nr:hypothetical protein [Photobacterium swingsii]PSW18666.1 hypothetical protein C9I94_24375 [Photobacterium swingsii]